MSSARNKIKSTAQLLLLTLQMYESDCGHIPKTDGWIDELKAGCRGQAYLSPSIHDRINEFGFYYQAVSQNDFRLGALGLDMIPDTGDDILYDSRLNSYLVEPIGEKVAISFEVAIGAVVGVIAFGALIGIALRRARQRSNARRSAVPPP